MNTNKNTIQIVLVIGIVAVVVLGVWAFTQYQRRPATQPMSQTGLPSTPAAGGANTEPSNMAEVLAAVETFTIPVADVDELAAAGKPIILVFGGPDGCASCRVMLPGLVEFYNEYRDDITIHFVDVWSSQQAIDGWPLMAIPTEFIFNADGTPFVPGDQFRAGSFDLIDQGGTHAFTRHTGPLSYDELVGIAQALLAAE
ncbi:MAG: thioredoxin family protein [Coriobacteriia bacterium]|nr:thioredoxin family protein [Coriobacteriia bacterium]